MNPFDVSILEFFNQFAQRWWLFDSAVVLVSRDHLFKGGLIVTILWWVWFRERDDQSKRREYILPAIITCIAAVFVARALALGLPFRERPLHTPELDFKLAYTMNPYELEGWSSFPSDHATLFFALATGIWFMSRRLGAFLFAYVLVVICLVRIYLGVHWPTDVVAGAVIGVGIGWAGNLPRVRGWINRPAWSLLNKSPGLFYAGFFLLSYQTASLFEDSRHIARYALDIVERLLASP